MRLTWVAEWKTMAIKTTRTTKSTEAAKTTRTTETAWTTKTTMSAGRLGVLRQLRLLWRLGNELKQKRSPCVTGDL